MNRSLLIIIVVIAVLGIVAGAYFLRGFFSAAPEAGEQPITSNSGSLPPAPDLSRTPLSGTGSLPSGGEAAAKFGVVTEGKVRDFYIDGQNNLFVVQPDGRVAKIVNGTVSMLSDSPIGAVSRASFSFDGKKALVVFGEQSSQQTSIFSIGTNTWQPLPAAIQNPAWAPNSHKIAFFSVGAESANLSTLDLSLKSPIPQALIRMYERDMTVAWPRPDHIVTSEKPSSLVKGSAYAYNVKTASLTVVSSDQEGLHFTWSPNENRGLAFVGGPTTRGNRLMLVDFSGGIVPLAITTLASKCAFGSETSAAATAPPSTPPKPLPPAAKHYLICAVPRSLQGVNQGRLLDVYEQRAFYTTDDFYRVDLETGNIETLFNDQAYEVDATNLKIFGDRVFFVNRYDERLYTIALK